MEIIGAVIEEIKPFYKKIGGYVGNFIDFLLKEHRIKGIGLLNGYTPKFCFIFIRVRLDDINRIKNMNNNINNYKTFFIIVYTNYPRRIGGLWSVKSKTYILEMEFPKCVRRIWGTLVKQ